MSAEFPWFGCWDGCDCTDVEPERADIPERCPLSRRPAARPRPYRCGQRRAEPGHRCTLPPLVAGEVTS